MNKKQDINSQDLLSLGFFLSVKACCLLISFSRFIFIRPLFSTERLFIIHYAKYETRNLSSLFITIS
jgi:hypothetical protein